MCALLNLLKNDTDNHTGKIAEGMLIKSPA